MPEPLTLATQAESGFEVHHKPTRRDVFLAEMDKVVLWSELCAAIEPFYPKFVPKEVVALWAWNACCAFTFLSRGMR